MLINIPKSEVWSQSWVALPEDGKQGVSLGRATEMVLMKQNSVKEHGLCRVSWQEMNKTLRTCLRVDL